MPRCAVWRAKAHEGTNKQNYLWYCDEHLAELIEHREEIIADLEARRKEVRGSVQPKPGRSARDGQGSQRGRRQVAHGEARRVGGPDCQDPQPLANI